MKDSLSQRVFNVFNILFLSFVTIVMLYPVLHILFASVSDATYVMSHQGLIFYPVGFNIEAYKTVFENQLIGSGYRNTLLVVIPGTILNVSITSLGAYALSKKDVYWNGLIKRLVVFTMFFSGGLIPLYLTVKNLGLDDSLLALILPTAINTTNLIIMRTSFEALPPSLEEAAKIDGANDFTVLLKIVMPLSMPIVSVMLLYYGVEHWNSWFNAMIYLRRRELYPLQLILREILIQNDTNSMMGDAGIADKEQIGEAIKYATIMVATLPILCVYPFLQKYFVSGVMVGAVKG